MIHHAAACFGLTLCASFVGFGNVVDTMAEITKPLAVILLLLFFVSLYRVLGDSQGARSADSQPRTLQDRSEIHRRRQRSKRPATARRFQP